MAVLKTDENRPVPAEVQGLQDFEVEPLGIGNNMPVSPDSIAGPYQDGMTVKVVHKREVHKIWV
jgi:hypothetical protein